MRSTARPTAPFRTRIGGAGLFLVAGCMLPLPAEGGQSTDASADSLASSIRRRVEAGMANGQYWVQAQRLTAERSLPAFYRGRAFRPAWVESGGVRPMIRGLIQAIEEAARDGLDPSDYHLDRIRSLADPAAFVDARSLVDLELLATDAFLVLGSHLLHGRVDPVRLRAEWLADRRGADMAAVLAAGLESGDVRGTLDALRPRQPGYRQMRDALVRLRETEAVGGWVRVTDGPTLRPGDSGPRVGELRRRLEASGDLAAPPAGDPEGFDRALEEAVLRFQRRHGLDADGAVGPATRAALNVGVADRIQRLVVNLERWRWMPEDLGRRHILVNIPDFAVVIREDGEAVLQLPAIVGREYRQTPVFSSRMTYLVLSPFWHVPPGIAANDKFPEIRRNPGYVAAQRMTLLDLRTNQPMDPSSIDWSNLTAAQFNQRYRLRQDPGPTNALGDVKFMFPNPYNVYLHDTPSRELFDRTERTFSSGCIRVDRPLELAELLLRENPTWTPDRIRRAVDARTETTITLVTPRPVHLQYWTAFMDDEGNLHYRRDIYDRDAAVLAALRADPPGA